MTKAYSKVLNLACAWIDSHHKNTMAFLIKLSALLHYFHGNNATFRFGGITKKFFSVRFMVYIWGWDRMVVMVKRGARDYSEKGCLFMEKTMEMGLMTFFKLMLVLIFWVFSLRNGLGWKLSCGILLNTWC